ncbi:MAG: glucosidase, partial [Candidatus Eremiobacteraeota bacterium]|nr:glucosidase [Candidatus Eremiobacteraeota bacterium]
DQNQHLCFAVSMWNGNDDRIKERFFGLSGTQGNHGEDVKEYYYYLDNLPSHAYMKALYKYPHHQFPYRRLLEENGRRSKQDSEFELMATGIFDNDEYFDVFIEYAKADADDILIKITAFNRAQSPHVLHLLPTLWFRNDWSWRPAPQRPRLSAGAREHVCFVVAEHPKLDRYRLYADGAPELLFTENDSNNERLYGVQNETPYVKDGINDFVVGGNAAAIHPGREGTKAAAHYIAEVPAGGAWTIRLRFCAGEISTPFANFDALFEQRRKEADDFYGQINPYPISDDLRNVQRQAFAGMLWSKQYYNYVVGDWLDGDVLTPPPPPERRSGRNRDWRHLNSADVISMPDKWEYPWFAAWDLAFHVIPLALIDPEFAKRQLVLLTREWYMHPNGQLPAYEWAFGDVNPPVHAWSALRIYQIEKKMTGRADRQFLERVFQKLLLNFTWWVNRKDAEGNNVFQGGFLGLDNIGVFDRSARLPTGGHLNQSDGTSWMAMYSLNMLAIALELAKENVVYEDIASKFFEHFLFIADAMNNLGGRGQGLWDEEDGFYYDVLKLDDGTQTSIKIRSLVGLLPLLAVASIEPEDLEQFPGFKHRLEWFIENRPDLRKNVACMRTPGVGERRLLAIVGKERLVRIMEKMLDEERFFGPYGIRAVSRFHRSHPYVLNVEGHEYRVEYEPAESKSGLFGGNSNWRGPVWFPINYLLVESIQKFHHYYGDELKVECPAGSGNMVTLWEVAGELSHRLLDIFRDVDGRRAVFGGEQRLQTDPHFRNYVLFYEYFHGDNGAGIGASHQTGWTGLVAKLVQQCAEYCGQDKDPLSQEAGSAKVPASVP